MLDAAQVTALLTSPRRWPQLDDGKVAEALTMGAVAFAVEDGEPTEQTITNFYKFAAQRLSAEQRARCLNQLSDFGERIGRQMGSGQLALAFLPFIHQDPDDWVVATAALDAAQLLPQQEGDSLAGPRAVLGWARRVGDDARKAAMIVGLLQLGDARVHALVLDTWTSLSDETQDLVLRGLGDQPPTLAAFEFAASVLALSPEPDRCAGKVSGGVIRLLHVASGEVTNSQYSGHGIMQLERAFPCWSVPTNEEAVRVVGHREPSEIAECIGPALQAAAAKESYPRVLPNALAELGLPDEAFRAAVQRALDEAGMNNHLGVIPDGIEVSTVPHWTNRDWLAEWGILNPFGPTWSHLLQVPCSGDRTAIVFAMHNPFAQACMVTAMVRSGDATALQRTLLEVAGQSEFDGVPLVQCLTHWVRVSGELPADFACTFFQRLFIAAHARTGATLEPIEAALAELHQLLAAGEESMQSQVQSAFARLQPALAAAQQEDATALDDVLRAIQPETASAWSDADFQRWVAAAGDAEHAEAQASRFIDYWSAATRFQQQADNL